MKSLRLALTFLSIPRLFLTLIFWPLFLGVIFAALQVTLSGFYISAIDRSPEQYREDILNKTSSDTLLLKTILPDHAVAATARLCFHDSQDSTFTNASCAIDNYDLVIKMNTLDQEVINNWEILFSGLVTKIHICQDCTSAIVIDYRQNLTITTLRDYKALILFYAAHGINRHQARITMLDAKQIMDNFKARSGHIYFTPANNTQNITLSNSETLVILLFNTATIIFIALWLLLRSHRKVLDYFAKNGALLPLVVACGKQTFYQSLWVTTIIRVLAFLISCVPATILLYRDVIKEESINLSLFADGPQLILWVLAVSLGMGTLTIIASVADLKERHSTLSPWFRIIPLICCLLGLALWAFSLIIPNPWLYYLQRIIVATPVLGILPVMFAPIIATDQWLLIVHIWLSALVTILLLRVNARWFAAHLEEL